MAKHGGYDSSHPWYYLTGGRILTVDEIRAESCAGCDKDRISKLNLMKEPRRSAEIKQLKASISDGLKRDAEIYAEQAARVEYRRRWLGPWQDQARDMWEEPNSGIGFKHNHLRYGFSQMLGLDALTVEEQLTLF
jgi:hypothetical protein